MEIAKEFDAYILCDEMYRGMDETYMPSILDFGYRQGYLGQQPFKDVLDDQEPESAGSYAKIRKYTKNLRPEDHTTPYAAA